MAETVYLIDLFSLVFQVFHAIPEMTSPAGEPTNAVFGITRDLFWILKQKRPDFLVVAGEGAGPGTREAVYAEYKANRSAMPEPLQPQIPKILQTIELFGIPLVSVPGWEADDVIATLTEQASRQGRDVVIITNDKDARQLLRSNVRLYNIRKEQYLGEAELLADWSVRPEQVVDFQSLVGDAVDNVPGVPLVGPKKASALLNQFGTLEEVLARADEVSGAKLKENLKTYADQARLSRTLVELKRDLPIKLDWELARPGRQATTELQDLFARYGFRRFVQEVRSLPARDNVSAAETTRAQEILPTKSSGTTDDPASQGTARKKKGVLQFDAMQGDEPGGDEPRGSKPATMSEAASVGDAPGATASPESTIGGHLSGPEEHAPFTNVTDGIAAPGLPQDGTSVTAATAVERRPLQFEIIDTSDKFDAFLAQLSAQPQFCLDLETTSVNPMLAEIVGWAISWEPCRGYYLPVQAPEGERHLAPQQVVERMRPILESPGVTVDNQNIKYDYIVLRNVGIEIRNIGRDPMVGSYLLEAGQRSYSLDELARRRLHHEMIPITALIGKGANERLMNQVPVRDVAEYSVEDAEIAWELSGQIEADLRREELWPLYWDLERPLIPIVAMMQYHGIRVDPEHLAKQSVAIGERLAGIRQEIHTLAGREFNIDSPLQLRSILFTELGLPVKKRTKTGPSTDQDVLEELAPLHPLPAKIVQHRGLQKLKNTYLDALPTMINPRTGRIHTSFNQVVAATGRLSSSDPNLQNIPIRTEEGQQVRKAFVAGQPDWVLLCADYSQIELRILAHFCGDPALTQAFAEERDIHTTVAAEIYGLPQSEVTAEMRRVAKAVNFGVIYGQSPYGLAATLGIAQDEAARFIHSYFEKYASIDQFLTQILEETIRSGYATTILGRRRSIAGIRSTTGRQRNLPERTAINTVIQGSAADLIKRAMINLTERLRQLQHPARLLLQIHDELVFETPRERLRDLAEIVQQEMQSAMKLNVPLKVDLVAGENWLETDSL